MKPVIHNPVELRQRRFEALVRELGWVNAVRFLHQYETGQGDYARERESILPNRTVDEWIREADRFGSPPPDPS